MNNQSPPSTDYTKLIQQFRDNPVMFMETFNVNPNNSREWQKEVLTHFAECSNKKHAMIAIRGGHGVGTSAFACWLMLWYFLTRTPVRINVMSVSRNQLEDAILHQLRQIIDQLPVDLRAAIKVMSKEIVLQGLEDQNIIRVRTVPPGERAKHFQISHAENILTIVDEASGVSDDVFNAIMATTLLNANSHIVLLGKLMRDKGFFYELFEGEKQHQCWYLKTINAEDVPQVSR